jgi:hypothetical protein
MQDEPKNDSTEPSEQTVPAENLEGANEQPEQTAPTEATEPTSEPAAAEATPEVVAPAAPVDATTPVGPTPTPTPGPRKKLTMPILVGIIVAAAIVILGGGGASAYFLWYQNPDKVVFDSFSHLSNVKTIDATGTLNITQNGDTYGANFEVKGNQNLESEVDLGVNVKASGSTYDVKGGLITDKDGNIYVKVNDVQKLLQQVAGADSASQIMNYYGDIVKEVDGQWIKISSDDLKSVDESYGDQQSCVTDAVKALNDDKSEQQAMGKLFESNRFITVGKSLGSKSIKGTDSLGYELGFDKTKAVAYFKALADTKFGKALKDCDSSYDFAKVSESDFEDSSKSTSTVSIWVSKFGHELTELSLTAKDSEKSTDGSLVIDPVFNKSVSVSVPTGAKSLKDVYADYQKATTDLESQFTSSYDYSSYSDPYSTSI